MAERLEMGPPGFEPGTNEFMSLPLGREQPRHGEIFPCSGHVFRYVASTGSRLSWPFSLPPACDARRLQRKDARRIEGLYDLHASRDAESPDERG